MNVADNRNNMGRKKKEDEQSPDYSKIRKDVKQSFYNYDKLFIGLMTSLNKCETKKELAYFISSVSKGFEDAPEELVQYLNSSIRNKYASLERKEEIDLSRLRAISNNTYIA